MRLSSLAITPKSSRLFQSTRCSRFPSCNVFRIARQHANGPQNKKQRADANHDRRNCENDAEPTLSRRVERRSSDECQSHREGGQQNASENQTLSEIQHAPGSMPEEGLLSFWGKHPPCAKSWTEEIKPLKAPKRTQGIWHTERLSLCHRQVSPSGAGNETSAQFTPNSALSRSKSARVKRVQPACAATWRSHVGPKRRHLRQNG